MNPLSVSSFNLHKWRRNKLGFCAQRNPVKSSPLDPDTD